MIGTYAAVLAVCGASLSIGGAAISLCGVRRWSWLAPAIGFALVCAICWGSVRLPGDGTIAAIAIAVLAIGSAIYLHRRLGGGAEAARAAIPVAIGALIAASLPFVVEGHFGILGTGFNPDMSQHLLATDRLADGAGGQLLEQGYPLGPHAVVVALQKGLGIQIVHGFDGLTIAIAILAPLTALAAFSDRPPIQRTAAALLVGLPFLVASYYAQGSFKETAQALLVLAFVLSLRESNRTWRNLQLRFIPAAVIAIGSVYAYSFPGLLWLAPVLLVWLALDRSWPLSPLLLALIVFLVGALPELGRMLDFHSFETFDPSGPGLGNLFGQISPFTALGIWPSGDFRVAPGDGAAPAAAFYLGAAFATVLLVFGAARAARGHERALLAGLTAVVAVYLAARLGGTAYTAAKALAIAAPIAALVIARGFRGAALAVYLLAAGICSLLAFVNAPVGPTAYSPALNSLRPVLGSEPTLVLASPQLLDEEHGARYLAWELRGSRVCIEPARPTATVPPPGVRYVIASAPPSRPPLERLTPLRRAGPYTVWERRGVRGGPSPCPLIEERQVRSGR